MPEYTQTILKFLEDHKVGRDLLVSGMTSLVADIKAYKNGRLVNDSKFEVVFQYDDIWGWIKLTFYDPLDRDNCYVLNTKYQIFRSDYLEDANYKNNILYICSKQDNDTVILYISTH